MGLIRGNYLDAKQIQTIADLRDVEGFDGASVQVLGYYESGDGGGGPVRVWKHSGVAGTYVDNGGSIIVPTGGDGSAAWLWDHSGPVNVKWFGAKGDGVSDDTVAIQNSVEKFKSVIIPQGIYKITSGIDFSYTDYIESHSVTFKADFTAGVAVTYSAPTGSLVENKKLLGSLLVDWVTKDWTKDKISFYFQNVYNSEFHIGSLKATRGVVCIGDESGTVHNDFHLSMMFTNLVGVYLGSKTATGWCNANRFHGGFFFGDGNPTGSLFASIAGHIYIESTPYQCNGNSFLRPSLEWGNTTGGFRLARLGGILNRLSVGYCEISTGDTTWIEDKGTQNFIDATRTPYLTGYDSSLSGSNNRIDVSGATEPWVAGPSGFYDVGTWSQTYKNSSDTKSTMALINTSGPSLRLKNASSSSSPSFQILNTNDSVGVSIPATGIWTVWNGSKKIVWMTPVAPISGAYTLGDIAYNSEPSAGGVVGWVCVASGTPGTWKSFGTISA